MQVVLVWLLKVLTRFETHFKIQISTVSHSIPVTLSLKILIILSFFSIITSSVFSGYYTMLWFTLLATNSNDQSSTTFVNSSYYKKKSIDLFYCGVNLIFVSLIFFLLICHTRYIMIFISFWYLIIVFYHV